MDAPATSPTITAVITALFPARDQPFFAFHIVVQGLGKRRAAFEFKRDIAGATRIDAQGMVVETQSRLLV